MAADTGAVSDRITPTRRQRTGRVKDLRAGQHGPGEPIYHALAERSPDFDFYFEDFSANAITATTGPFVAGGAHTWAYAESNAGATDPAKLAPSTTKTSAMTLATSANAYNQTLLGPKMYNADKFPFIEVGMWFSQVTDMQFTLGFADAIPASAAAIVADIDTPSVTTVADGAFYAIDISQTLKTAALVCVGTSSAVNKVVVAPTAAPFGVPTLATFIRIRVQLEGTGVISAPSIARLFINDALVAENFAGPDSEKMLCPVILQGSPGGTAFVGDYDYIKCVQQKAGSPL